MVNIYFHEPEHAGGRKEERLKTFWFTPDLQLFHERANRSEPIEFWRPQGKAQPMPLQLLDVVRSSIHMEYYLQALEMARRMSA